MATAAMASKESAVDSLCRKVPRNRILPTIGLGHRRSPSIKQVLYSVLYSVSLWPAIHMDGIMIRH